MRELPLTPAGALSGRATEAETPEPFGGKVTQIGTGRAASQVLVFPFRREGDGFVYGLFRREDASYWQGVAGGGEAGESPLEAAHREALEEAGVGDGAEFVALDTRATMPVIAVTGEFTWGPEVLVIQEYAFGVGVEGPQLRLSDEHTEYGCAVRGARLGAPRRGGPRRQRSPPRHRSGRRGRLSGAVSRPAAEEPDTPRCCTNRGGWKIG